MMWREADDLSEILAALDNGQRVERKVPVGGPWFLVLGVDQYWVQTNLDGGTRFRIEVPDAPSLPPGVVVVDTKKAQARHCPALIHAGWTARYLTTGGPLAESVVRTRADAWPGDWFEVCPPEGER